MTRLAQIGLVAGLLLVATAAHAQTSYPLGQALTFAWDAVPNEVDSGTTAYLVRLDAGATVNRGMAYSWPMPQASLTLGTHTVFVRACQNPATLTTCGPEASLTFTIVRPLPGTPGNPRITPAALAVLSVPKAVDYAQAYCLWAIDRACTDTELAWLASRHPAGPPTKATVAQTLEAAYAELVP